MQEMRRLLILLLFLTACGAGFAAENQLSDQHLNQLTNQLTGAEKREGWILLFDGASLDGWMNPDGSPSRRPAEDGSINPYKSGGYFLVTKPQWENFILKADFKISKGCNSGIFVRTTPLTAYPGKSLGHNGIEFQIYDSTGTGYHDTGAIYDLVKPRSQAMRPVGEWNHVVITADRNIIAVRLNGVEVSRMDLDEFAEPYLRPDGTRSKFSWAWKDRPRKGHIALQDHGGDVWFRNIKLKVLD